jgi:glycosyltransferase involved in cell wall biosynthesis
MPEPKCVFLVEDHAISPDSSGGGAALRYSRLQFLAHSGWDIALVILSHPNSPGQFSDFIEKQSEIWEMIKGWCVSYQKIDLQYASRDFNSLRLLWLGLTAPSRFRFRRLDQKSDSDLIRVLEKENPTIIWADNRFPAVHAVRSKIDVPIIYSHYDWLWRIKRYRFGKKSTGWRYKFRFWVWKRSDRWLMRRVAGSVSGSTSEATEMRSLGASNVAYFPPTYVPVELSKLSRSVSAPRIVHLGGMQTTATRKGLERFLEVTWPILCRGLDEQPEFWVIGNMKGAPKSLLGSLDQVGAVCPGFVKDLKSVLRPFDIHVVPWEHNTGTRTRIPLALNYGQILVSTKPAAACFPSLRHNVDCILVDDLHCMASEIIGLLTNQQRRKRIGVAARKAFMENFTREALQSSFNRFLCDVVSSVS